MMYSVLSMPDLKNKFEPYIDFEKWEKASPLSTHLIPIKSIKLPDAIRRAQ